MNRVRRVFVEKKPAEAVEARALLSDLKENLGLEGLRSVRILNRYDVDGLSDEEFSAACTQVLSEPAVDLLYEEDAPLGEGCFAVEYLPGQYDQRADSAAQCIQLLTQKERPAVRTAKVYVLEGADEAETEAARRYLINPVECREASLDKPENLDPELVVPPDVAVMEGFCALDREGLTALHDSMGLAMTVEDLAFCQDYFRKSGRDPFLTEIRVIDTYWSDHCRHTTFQTHLDQIHVDGGPLAEALHKAATEYLAARDRLYGKGASRPITLMDMGTICTKEMKREGKLPDLDESEEINACSIKVRVKIDGREEDYLVMFKNETHNHPTEIEPFGGAATCLGGAIRDPLSGRSYVYQAMRVTGSGDPTVPTSATLPGKLPSRKITTGAAAGYSSYGNQIGLATGLVDELYHPGFMAKRMEIGAVIAAAPAKNVVRERPEPGDVVVLMGGRTGRDGCGGATGSSKAHTEESITTCGAEVQKGNPLTERKLQRLFRNPDFSTRVRRCNDFGAGGVCVAIGELADGLSIDLDAVPKKYEGLDGTELAISESQERMAVVVRKEDVEAVLNMAEQENLEAVPVAVVTEEPRLVMRWRGKVNVDLSRAFLDTNGVSQHATATVTQPDMAKSPLKKTEPLTREALIGHLSSLQHCSRRGLAERFDATIGAGSVLMPFGGKYQLTPAQAMAALIPVAEGKCSTATLMTYGYDPYLSEWSPFHGASYAVVESLARLTAAGGAYETARLTFQEYFERMGSDPLHWGKPVAALLGAQQAQRAFGTPAIGGKDSMSGSFDQLSVPPTLVSFAVTTLDAGQVVSNEFKRAGSRVVLFKAEPKEDLTPDYGLLCTQFSRVTKLLREKKGISAAAVTTLAATVAKSCFGNGLGFAFEGEHDLFNYRPGSILVELEEGADIPEGATLLGYVTLEPVLSAGTVAVPVNVLQSGWEKTLRKVFPAAVSQQGDNGNRPLFTERSACRPAQSIAQPRVVIPAFPGTNCEIDSARAMERAGAKADVILVRNMTPAAIEESIDALVKAIENAQMIFLPGGFSGGDEPDGSGKFIATTFRNPRVMEAVMELLNHRDGLMLGICNGFQALIKLGLVPYGDIRPMTDESPTLTFNTIGRHMSRIVRTRVTSVKSPWFALCEPGEMHSVAISHGEGRFIAPKEEMERLFAAGQVATQYVDLSGAPTMDVESNPNGAVCAVEGITSPDGRILGKMGHSERWVNGLYRNVPGDYDQKIFASGVRYFR